MTVGRYHRALRGMTALDHFATDYQPVTAACRCDCLCDVEPGVFTVFTFAVLAMHQIRPARSGPVRCGCGQPADTCPVRALADGLLFAPPGDLL